MDWNSVKAGFCTFVGVIGAAICTMLGGWDDAIKVLCIFILIDIVTALLLAGVFHNSPKTEDGRLESRTILKGLFRKGFIFAVVIMAHYLDVIAGTEYIRDAACIALIVEEAISITENLGLMGVPIPKAIRKGIDLLKDDDEEQM